VKKTGDWSRLCRARIASRADLNSLIANFDYKSSSRNSSESPHKAVEKSCSVVWDTSRTWRPHLQKEAAPNKLDIEVVDICRDRSRLEFKRDSEAESYANDTELKIENSTDELLQKLSLFQETSKIARASRIGDD
jgi:hypothetical protein